MGRIRAFSLLEPSTGQALWLPAASPPGTLRPSTADFISVSSAFAVSLYGPQLTHLRCINVHFPPKELLAVLRSTPALIDLQLTDIFELGTLEDVFDQDLNEEIVSLPALQCLALTSYSRAGLLSVAFLEHIRVPPSATTFLAYSYDDHCSPEELPDLDELFRRIVDARSYNNTPFRACRIIESPQQSDSVLQGEQDDFGYPHHLLFALWPTAHGLEDLGDPDVLPDETLAPGKLSIMFKGPCSWSLPSLFHAALATPLLSHVSALMLHGAALPLDTWQHFASCANVAQLGLSPHGLAYSFVSALADPAHAPFPALETVALQAIYWSRGLLESDYDDAPFSERCHDALAARLAQGIPLRTVIITSTEELPEARIEQMEADGLVETAVPVVYGAEDLDLAEEEDEEEGAYFFSLD
ncbi:hypothetical protein PsYK624_090390 [Phanerochaete sordida]|uniref:Uncharacterized protein n=1 Tax=Phanerochaete sordida TaxID=48140 RepID=A0A9P3GDP2_9APHY|nr:hypothetical protein PsYK624_090390 [Phanerochaete sordida]